MVYSLWNVILTDFHSVECFQLEEKEKTSGHAFEISEKMFSFSSDWISTRLRVYVHEQVVNVESDHWLYSSDFFQERSERKNQFDFEFSVWIEREDQTIFQMNSFRYNPIISGKSRSIIIISLVSMVIVISLTGIFKEKNCSKSSRLTIINLTMTTTNKNIGQEMIERKRKTCILNVDTRPLERFSDTNDITKMQYYSIAAYYNLYYGKETFSFLAEYFHHFSKTTWIWLFTNNIASHSFTLWWMDESCSSIWRAASIWYCCSVGFGCVYC